MSIEGQGHFFTIYFSGFVCFVLYLAKISGERLQDHWSSGSVSGELHRQSWRDWYPARRRRMTCRTAVRSRCDVRKVCAKT